MDYILNNYLDSSETDVIYLDYAKAFDKVDHKLLIRKLHLYGLNPKIIKWIESFLSDRKQAVVVDGHLSFLALIISGVPQGTVLGPILFLIFINDIEHCITESIIRCFADDTRVSISITCEQDVSLLQKDLNSVIKWSERNNIWHCIKTSLSTCVTDTIDAVLSSNFLLSVNCTSTQYPKTSHSHL